MESPIGKAIEFNILLAVALLFHPPLLAAQETIQTPRQLVENLVQSARQGDVDRFLSFLTPESRKMVAAYYEGRARVEQTQKDFDAALDQQFGKGEEILAPPPDDLRITIARLSAAEVMSENPRPDGSVELRVQTVLKSEKAQGKSRQDTLIARREEGVWKLSLGDPATAEMADHNVAAAQRLIQEVRAGKYPDRFAAMLALDKAWRNKASRP